MRMHFPDMMASMDVKKEMKRLDAVDLTVRSCHRRRARQRVLFG